MGTGATAWRMSQWRDRWTMATAWSLSMGIPLTLLGGAAPRNLRASPHPEVEPAGATSVEAVDDRRGQARARRTVDAPVHRPTTPPSRTCAGFRDGCFVRWAEYDLLSGDCYV